MKSIIGIILSVVITLFCILVLPEDTCLTILTIGQFFTFLFLGAYGTDDKINPLNPVAAVLAAFCLAEGEISLLTPVAIFLNAQWVWVPDYKFVIVLGIINCLGYFSGLIILRRRQKKMI